jgi:hypothetical protein
MAGQLIQQLGQSAMLLVDLLNAGVEVIIPGKYIDGLHQCLIA